MGQRHDLGAAKDLQAGILLGHRGRDVVGQPQRRYALSGQQGAGWGAGRGYATGLLDGPAWLSWSAAADGRLLIRIWDGITLSGRLS